MVKNQPAMQETRVQSLGWEDPQDGMLLLFSHITQNQKKKKKKRRERERVCVNFYIQNSVATLKYHYKFSYSQINVYIIYRI